jgi:hypothetical protein
MSILDHASILNVHKAALRAGLMGSRDALLAGIDRRFVYRITRASSPSDQLLIDLDELNDAEVLDDGTVPLAQWLQNASHLGEARREVSVFQNALEVIESFVAEGDEDEDEEEEDDGEEDNEEDDDGPSRTRPTCTKSLSGGASIVRALCSKLPQQLRRDVAANGSTVLVDSDGLQRIMVYEYQKHCNVRVRCSQDWGFRGCGHRANHKNAAGWLDAVRVETDEDIENVLELYMTEWDQAAP